MWMARCTDRQCRWEGVSATRISAEFDAHIHQFYDDGDQSPRVHVFEVPDEVASPHIRVQNATT